MSFLAGFGIILGGVLIAAPRRSLRFIPLLVVGFVIPFLPYFIADAFRGFEWTRAFVGPESASGGHSIDCIPCTLPLIFVKLTGGQFYLPTYVPDIGLPAWLTAALLNVLNLPVMLVVGFAFYAIAAMVRTGRASLTVEKSADRFLIYVLVVAPIILLPYASNFNARYYIVFIVPFVIMAATAFALLVQRYENKQAGAPVANIFITVLSGVVALKAIIVLGYYSTRPPETMSAYSFKRDVVLALNADWGLKADQISKRASTFIVDNPRPSGGWHFLGENQGLDYIATVHAPGTTPPNADECVAVVARWRLTEDPVDVPEDLLSTLPPVFDHEYTRTKQYPGFSIVGFRSKKPSNCPRSFTHSYFLSPEQRLIAERLTVGGSRTGAIQRIDGDGGVFKYVLTYPGSDVPGLMAVARNDEHGIDVVLHSLNMGGYSVSLSYSNVALNNPGFVLESTDTQRRFERSLEGTMGEHGLYTPYTFDISGVPAGTYLLRFTADGYTVSDSASEKPYLQAPAFDIVLDESLKIGPN